MRLGLLTALLGAAVSLSTPAHASADFILRVTDDPGVGFDDQTPATPVGGNTGTTIGAQRRLAFQYALGIWGKLLDSPVPIIVEASFGALECGAAGAVAGQASPAGVVYGVPGLPPGLVFAEALADRILEMDVDPDMPDITAQFNASLEDCLGIGWYYGLDGKSARTENDLVYVVLHEIAHGLGFMTTSDPTTGEPLLQDYTDPFMQHMLDNSTRKRWSGMTALERTVSATNVRNVVWDGSAATAAAAKFLTKGAPNLTVSPALSGLGGALSEGNFGLLSTTTPVTGPLAVGTVSADCMNITGSFAGSVVLLTGAEACHPLDFVGYVTQAGGLGLLLPTTWGGNPPASLTVASEDLSGINVRIPVLGISTPDAMLLQQSSGESLTLSSDGALLDGADAAGRVYLYASDPIVGASTGSHWDPLVRPDLVLEPVASPNPSHDVTVELALLRDIGWAPYCGNGRLDDKEECDDGASNSDTRPGACRANCTKPKCGDAIVDPGEACDDGVANSDRAANACRSNCVNPVCGDGVVDKGEDCDNGKKNSDTEADACRTTCAKAKCGDGVVDRGEVCDDGAANSDTNAGACRTTCVSAKCGDGVVDTGEECDKGSANGDAPGACRTTCKNAKCGDGIVDTGEECDKGSANSDTTAGACRSTCKNAKCGDGVVDPGEDCDEGPANSDTTAGACRTTCKDSKSPSESGDAGRKSGAEAPKGSSNSDGCGCRLVAPAPGSRRVGLLLTAALALYFRRRPKTRFTVLK